LTINPLYQFAISSNSVYSESSEKWGCGKNPGSDSILTSIETSEYSHPIANIKYPADWKIAVEKDLAFSIVSPLNPDSQLKYDIVLTLLVLPSAGDPVEDIVAYNINKMKQKYNGFSLVGTDRVAIANQSSQRLVFTYYTVVNGQQSYHKTMQIYLPVGNRVYFVQYDAAVDKFCEFLPPIQGLLASMQVKEEETRYTIKRSGISFDISPVDIAINPLTNIMYITFSSTDKVYVVDGSTHKIITNITLGSAPANLALNSVTDTLYVTSPETNKVYVVDVSTQKVISNIPLGPKIGNVDIDTNEFGGTSSIVFVTNSGNNTVSVIDGSTNEVIMNMKVGEHPLGIAIDPVMNRAYVSNNGDNTVYAIDYVTYLNHTFKATIASKINVGLFPAGLAFDSDTAKLYVTNSGNNTVSVIDSSTNTMIMNIIVGSFPNTVAVNQNNSRVYVSNTGDNTVSVINYLRNQTIPNVSDIQVDSSPYSITVNPRTNNIYTANYVSKTVSVIDGNTNALKVGISYTINPPNAGIIVCNGNTIAENTYIDYMANSELECEAIPSRGFTFSSWSGESVHLSNSSDKSSTNPIKVTHSKFGNIAANFIIPANLIPESFVVGLYGVLVSVFAGWFVPNIARWMNGRRQSRYLSQYMTMIDSMPKKANYALLNKYKRLQLLEEIKRIKSEISEMLVKGKISESQYGILDNKISDYEKGFETLTG
jgi:YVTN family beta-propeller protein